MRRQHSVAHRLRRDLGLVALFGALLLLGAIVFFYWRWISSLPLEQARVRAVYEMLEHVLLPLLVLMLPVAWVGQRIIRGAFAPLEAAATEIAMLNGNERGYRIDIAAMPAEAVPFVTAVNELLKRLDAAARQQEAFAGDVAHELRTPLALLALELDRLDHDDAARLRADVNAMQRLVDQLLLLAQVEAAIATNRISRPVMLADIARDVVGRLAPGIIADGRQIELDDDGGGVVVHGRPEAIAAALRNLIENAERVTPAGGTVHVVVGPGPMLGVRDEGEGLTPEHLRDLVQRHHRADHASRNGAGLGLAIVNRIMVAHGGHLGTSPEIRQLSLHFPSS